MARLQKQRLFEVKAGWNFGFHTYYCGHFILNSLYCIHTSADLHLPNWDAMRISGDENWGRDNFYVFLKDNFSCIPVENREAAICAMLMILALIWSLTQDDKAHESAFKNCFHAGVFHQPELGMEHVQHRNADVQVESWRPESKYSTDLANRKILLTWNLEVFDLKSWWIMF